MDLSDLKTYSEILRNILTSSGVFIGGIWTYFKFIKGRIHSPKIETQLESKMMTGESNKNLLCGDVIIKNVGNTIILPEKVEIKIEGIQTNETDIILKIIKSDFDILDFNNKPESNTGQYYVDPFEFSSRYFDCLIGNEFRAILVTVTINYNVKRTLKEVEL